jgi:anhydro-N-acetylmuramic acid kinase
MNAPELIRTDHEYGRLLGEICTTFIEKHQLHPELIASHGHTVFHRPKEGFSFQIGNGNDLAAVTGIPVVSDFRSLDISLGGNGAPLVPVGDRLLFSDYDSCLNLGGFSNISMNKDSKTIAYDICPVNIVLNYFSEKVGEKYDKDGALGWTGTINDRLLKELDDLAYYSLSPPKSLGREYIHSTLLPIFENYKLETRDFLRTYYEHIAGKIVCAINYEGNNTSLFTGGGAKNKFLVQLIKNKTKVNIVIPEEDIIDFKEAIIFAFLGLLRKLGQINCLASVTGAKKDSSVGILTEPPQ